MGLGVVSKFRHLINSNSASNLIEILADRINFGKDGITLMSDCNVWICSRKLGECAQHFRQQEFAALG
ncbi:MAG: hypothetical protein JWM11_4943 [Planctomycetaceae bacterium]|nr:hypothetical protein [Planctomycetaceae bacterium]